MPLPTSSGARSQLAALPSPQAVAHVGGRSGGKSNGLPQRKLPEGKGRLQRARKLPPGKERDKRRRRSGPTTGDIRLAKGGADCSSAKRAAGNDARPVAVAESTSRATADERRKAPRVGGVGDGKLKPAHRGSEACTQAQKQGRGCIPPPLQHFKPQRVNQAVTQG